MVAVAAARYSVEVELVAVEKALRLGLGRPYPCAAARATTRHNLVNLLSPMIPLMLPVVSEDTVATVLLETEVMGPWTVTAVASAVQGVAGAKPAFHLGLAPLPYQHSKCTQSLSFLLVTVLWVAPRSRPPIPRTLQTWHS